MARGRPNVEKQALALLEATRNLLVSGTLFLSGTIKFSDGSVLSTATGSIGDQHNLLTNTEAPFDDHTQYVHIDGRRGITGDLGVSGSLIIGAGGFGTIFASASCLVLSCSYDSHIITSGSHVVMEDLEVLGTIYNPEGHLILSSSVGSTVSVSGNLEILSGSGDLFMGQGQSIMLDGQGGGNYLTYIGSNSVRLYSNNQLLTQWNGTTGTELYKDLYMASLSGESTKITSTPSNGDLILSSSNVHVSGALVVAGDITVEGSVISNGAIDLAGEELFFNSGSDPDTYAVYVGSDEVDFLANGVNLSLQSNLTRFDKSIQLISGSTIEQRDQHLILSSSAGSQITVSGVLHPSEGIEFVSGQTDILGNSTTLFLRSENIALNDIGGSAAASVTINSNTTSIGPSTRNLNIDGETIEADDTHLILSSSAGSIIRVSGALHTNGSDGVSPVAESTRPIVLGVNQEVGSDTYSATYVRLGGDLDLSANGDISFNPGGPSTQITVPSGQGGITADLQHLILSSSVGSQITISGNLEVLGDFFGNETTGSFDFFVQNELDVQGYLTSSTDGYIQVSGALALDEIEGVYFDADRDTRIHGGNVDDRIFFGIGGATNNYEFQANVGIFRRPLNFTVGASSERAAVVATDADLILSSSAGSTVHISGVLSLPQVNNQTSPSIQFGDGDTGFYESADDDLCVTLSGGRKWFWDDNNFNANITGGAALVNETASSTNPTLVPHRGDYSTGIGAATTGQLSLIANATTVLTATPSEVQVGGSIDLRVRNAIIYDNFAHLTLSSSAGSNVHVSGTLSVGDSGFNLDASTTSLPTINFDSGDFIRYNRSSNLMNFNIGSDTKFRIDQNINSYYELHFPNDASAQSAHIISDASHLILSSSGVSESTVVVSGALVVKATDAPFNGGTSITVSDRTSGGGGHEGDFIANTAGVNLRSTFGRLFLTTQNAQLAVDLSNDKLYAVQEHLILSSSVGSRVTVSGNLSVTETALIPQLGVNLGSISPSQADLYVDNEIWAVGTAGNAGANPRIVVGANTSTDWGAMRWDSTAMALNFLHVGHNGTNGVFAINSKGELYSPTGPLILSSSVGSTVVVSGNLEILSGSGDVLMGNGQSIILDDDGDTYITSDADDVFRVRVGGQSTFALEPQVLTLGNGVDVQLNTDGFIYSAGGHLVLSSSAGSRVHVSGNLKLGLGVPSQQTIILDDDDDSYIYGSADDNIAIRTGGSTRLVIRNTQLIVRDIPINNDTSHLVLSSSAGSVVYVSGNLQLPQVNDATSPTLSFGDGDTGLYESAINAISISTAGVKRFEFSAGGLFQAAAVNGPALFNTNAGSTTPNVLPNRADTDTGLGSAGADELSLIAGGVEVARADASSLVVFQNLYVSGTQFAVSSSDLVINDPLIVVANSQSGTPTYDAGVLVNRGTSENVAMIWDESEDHFAFVRTTDDGSTFGGIPLTGYRDLKLSNIMFTTGVLTPEGSDITISGALRVDGGFTSVRLTNPANSRLDFLDTNGAEAQIRAQSVLVGGGGERFDTVGLGLSQNSVVAWSNTFFGSNTKITEISQLGSGSIGLSGSSGDFTIAATSGDLYLSSSATSIVRVDGDLYVSPGYDIRLLGTSGDIIISGQNAIRLNTTDVRINKDLSIINGDDVFYNEAGHLILSSSVGSTITTSGSLKVIKGSIVVGDAGTASSHSITLYGPVSDKTTVLAQNSGNSYLYGGIANQSLFVGVSPGGGSVFSKTFFDVNDNNGATNKFSFRVLEQNLVSIDTIAGLSASLNLRTDGAPNSGQIIASTSDLILSASGGNMMMSGNLIVNPGTSNISRLNLNSSNGNILQNGTNAIRMATGVVRIGNDRDLILQGENRSFYHEAAHLILSSSVGSVVAISGNLKLDAGEVRSHADGTLVDTASVIVDSFDGTAYRTVKYIVSVTSGSSYQSQEMLLIHSASTAALNEYAIITLPSDAFVGFQASVTGSTVNLLASGSAPENTVKLVKTRIAI